jgi:protein-S-isoprenylcysteine O-methyltransferase Ste14
MYAAALLLLWSSILGHFSAITIGVGVLVTIVAAIRIMTEDQQLLARFPDYAEYSRTTRRIVPFIL